jgi:metallo-beta-lactamase family protein
MEINFIGPLGKVTGSCTWLRDEQRGWSFLVDCGMQQGEVTAAEWNNQVWPFNPAEIQFVILTHAHIDHSGLLPCLYRDGFKGKVYCTEETAIFAKILLEDAMNIGDKLFTKKHLKQIRWSPFRREPVLGRINPVADDLFIQFLRTGHILGAVSACIYWGDPKSPDQKSIVFSGDIGPQREDQEVLPMIRHTMAPRRHHYAVLESTYGSKVRGSAERDPEERRRHLKRLLLKTIETNGTLIIPCFALGRSQDVMFDLHGLVAESPEGFKKMDFFLDYPLAQKLNEATAACWKKMENNGKKVRPAWIGKQVYRLLGLRPNDPESINETFKALDALVTDRDDPSWFGLQEGNEIAANWRPIFSLTRVPDADQIKAGHAPTVIVTGSGNCQSGKAAKWLPALLNDESVTVALTGFCGGGTVGRELLDIADLSMSERQLHTSKEITWETNGATRGLRVAEVKAAIEYINGYSAHGDQSDLVNWAFGGSDDVFPSSGRTIFLQHGDDLNRKALRNALNERASQSGADLKVILPANSGEWISLESGALQDPDARALQELLARRPDLKARAVELVE